MPATMNPARIRAHFPALSRGGASVFLDNAGGSQMPRVVAEAMLAYMTGSFVQTGADYAESVRASAVVRRAHEFLEVFGGASERRSERANEGARGTWKAIVGGSTSQLCLMLAQCYGDVLSPGDEVIVCETAHESNRGPWMRLASRGIGVKEWRVDPATGEALLRDRGGVRGLASLLGPRTKLVAFPQVSNVLGEVVDLGPIVQMVHEAGARVVVDGVAYAPHRAIDVAGWDLDWYVYSTYKVFGPHAAVLYGRGDALAELTGPNHGFIPREEVPRKFELGGANHESCAGILALDAYLREFVGAPQGALTRDPDALLHAKAEELFDRAIIERAMAEMEALELPLQARLMEFLVSHPRVRIVGPAHAERSRVCTISFVHRGGKSSREIAQACNARGLGVRYGNFYAWRLCEALGLQPRDGVVRVSLAHYNTIQEVESLCACLRAIL